MPTPSYYVSALAPYVFCLNTFSRAGSYRYPSDDSIDKAGQTERVHGESLEFPQFLRVEIAAAQIGHALSDIELDKNPPGSYVCISRGVVGNE